MFCLLGYGTHANTQNFATFSCFLCWYCWYPRTFSLKCLFFFHGTIPFPFGNERVLRFYRYKNREKNRNIVGYLYLNSVFKIHKMLLLIFLLLGQAKHASRFVISILSGHISRVLEHFYSNVLVKRTFFCSKFLFIFFFMFLFFFFFLAFSWLFLEMCWCTCVYIEPEFAKQENCIYVHLCGE